MMARRSISLPSGTTLQGVSASGVVRVFEDQIMGMTIDASNNVQIIANYGNTNNPALVTVPFQSAALAFAFLAQIQNFLGSDSQGMFIPALPFQSIAPESAVHTSVPPQFVYGYGFSNRGITNMQYNDGVDLPVGINFFVQTDNRIWLAGIFGPYPVTSYPMTYKVQYSTDSGATYTDTGLTFTLT